MADKTVQLNAPNGGTVTVAAEKVENLLRNGFTEVKAAPKASSSKSSTTKK
jgi:hypothetical protein